MTPARGEQEGTMAAVNSLIRDRETYHVEADQTVA